MTIWIAYLASISGKLRVVLYVLAVMSAIATLIVTGTAIEGLDKNAEGAKTWLARGLLLGCFAVLCVVVAVSLPDTEAIARELDRIHNISKSAK